jgi:cadmium resistance transport/sequestration family protein
MTEIWLANNFGNLLSAVAAFIATNLDDILVLMLFFSQTQQRRIQIVIGQYLGFGVLVLLSLPGYFGGALIPRAWIGLLGLLPLAIGLKLLWKSDAGATAAPEIDHSPTRPTWLRNLLSPLIYQVAAVTIANGGDNISIYIPLFAGKTLIGLATILVTFFLMVGLWCWLALGLIRQPAIGKLLTTYGDRLVPWIFIALGLYILADSRTITDLFRFT